MHDGWIESIDYERNIAVLRFVLDDRAYIGTCKMESIPQEARGIGNYFDWKPTEDGLEIEWFCVNWD